MNGAITKYVYDNEDIIAEYNGNNQLIASYTHGKGIDEPISMTNGQTYYYHTDALGSVIAITDSNRNVVQRYEYDSFGNITSVLDPNFTQPYTYTAREYDPESGLYYYRARYYDAEVGRFIGEDPIGFKGGINFFAYVGNNPVNDTDPLGLLSGEGSDPIIGPPPTDPPGSEWWECGTKRANCNARAHWEYEMCMRGKSRDYDKCQTKKDNCFERMRFRLEECLKNADKSCKK